MTEYRNGYLLVDGKRFVFNRMHASMSAAEVEAGVLTRRGREVHIEPLRRPTPTQQCATWARRKDAEVVSVG